MDALKKKICMLLSIMMTMCFFVSCGDDDGKDDSQVDKSLLVGKWVLTNLVTEDESGTDTESYAVSEEVDVIIFTEDGSCRNYSEVEINGKKEYDWDDKGNWSLVDDKTLKLLFYGEGQQTVKVLKMTATTLSFECSLSFEGENYKYTATYQKVS